MQLTAWKTGSINSKMKKINFIKNWSNKKTHLYKLKTLLKNKNTCNQSKKN